MVAWVLAPAWRRIGGVTELTRAVRLEVVLWVPPLKVSAQAISPKLSLLRERQGSLEWACPERTWLGSFTWPENRLLA